MLDVCDANGLLRGARTYGTAVRCAVVCVSTQCEPEVARVNNETSWNVVSVHVVETGHKNVYTTKYTCVLMDDDSVLYYDSVLCMHGFSGCKFMTHSHPQI